VTDDKPPTDSIRTSIRTFVISVLLIAIAMGLCVALGIYRQQERKLNRAQLVAVCSSIEAAIEGAVAPDGSDVRSNIDLIDAARACLPSTEHDEAVIVLRDLRSATRSTMVQKIDRLQNLSWPR
jgi:hypothetical protein